MEQHNEGEDNFKARTSPRGLFNLITQLNDQQKRAVEEIGFGSLLLLGISKCPGNLCKYLVRSFSAARVAIELERGEEIQIDEEDVEAVLQLPRGEVRIVESTGKASDPLEYITFLQRWRRRWGIAEDHGAPCTGNMVEHIIANRTGDADFKVDFVVYVVSSFLWTMQTRQCRFKILRSLMKVEEIRHFNWCHFTLEGLVESTRNWKINKINEDRRFTGPITFLLLCYLDRVQVALPEPRSRPVIAFWDNDRMMKRLKNEEGGYGKGRTLPRIPRSEEVSVVHHEEEFKRRVEDAIEELSHLATRFGELSCQYEFPVAIKRAASNVDKSSLTNLARVIEQIIHPIKVEEGSSHDLSNHFLPQDVEDGKFEGQPRKNLTRDCSPPIVTRRRRKK